MRHPTSLKTSHWSNSNCNWMGGSCRTTWCFGMWWNSWSSPKGTTRGHLRPRLQSNANCCPPQGWICREVDLLAQAKALGVEDNISNDYYSKYLLKANEDGGVHGGLRPSTPQGWNLKQKSHKKIELVWIVEAKAPTSASGAKESMGLQATRKSQWTRSCWPRRQSMTYPRSSVSIVTTMDT